MVGSMGVRISAADRAQALRQRHALVVPADLWQIKRDFQIEFLLNVAVLIHMCDAILHTALAAIVPYLKPDGVMYASVNLASRSDRACQQFLLVSRPRGFYQEALTAHSLNIVDLGPLQVFGRHPRNPQEHQRTQRMPKTWPAATIV